MNIYESIIDTVGRTPLVKLQKITGDSKANVLAKLEFFNPASSIKDRIAVSMVNEAEASGALKPGGTIIEPTSGNTGLGLAMVAAAKGYKLIIVMPETMSNERKLLMKHFGAELVLTPGEDGMQGAIDKAEELHKSVDNSFMPQQFDNPANPKAHEDSTALEIWNDTDGTVDAIVAGVGTGGTLTGIAKALKAKKPAIKIVAVEPETSAVLSNEPAGRHNIQGIGAGFVPGVLDAGLIDEVVKVSDDDSIDVARKAATEEGILCGISSGAAIKAALELAELSEYEGKNIVVILPDTGERYMSTELFN
jgi:cysteine synthase A